MSIFQYECNHSTRYLYIELHGLSIEGDSNQICFIPQECQEYPICLDIDKDWPSWDSDQECDSDCECDQEHTLEPEFYIEFWYNDHRRCKQYIVKCGEILRIDVRNMIGNISFRYNRDYYQKNKHNYDLYSEWRGIRFCTNLLDVESINSWYHQMDSHLFYRDLLDLALFKWVYRQKKRDLPWEIWDIIKSNFYLNIVDGNI